MHSRALQFQDDDEEDEDQDLDEDSLSLHSNSSLVIKDHVIDVLKNNDRRDDDLGSE